MKPKIADRPTIRAFPTKTPPLSIWNIFFHSIQEQTGQTFPRDQVEALAKRLGNMVLIKKTDNKKLGNGNFTKKKPILTGAQYVTTKMVGTFNDWSPQNLEKCQKKLAEYALKAWPLK